MAVEGAGPKDTFGWVILSISVYYKIINFKSHKKLK